MGKKMTRSRASISSPSDFFDQNIIVNEELCTYGDLEIQSLFENESFPEGTEIRPYDPKVKSDFVSSTWVAFPDYPFSLGLKYPFTGLIAEFVEVTKISYIQAMPVIWRILYWINLLNEKNEMKIGVNELASVYDLQTHGSSRFLFKLKTGKNRLVLKSKQNDGPWKERFFFVKRKSIPNGEDLPAEWIRKGRNDFIFHLPCSDFF
jgi:hypothetical protein